MGVPRWVSKMATARWGLRDGDCDNRRTDTAVVTYDSCATKMGNVARGGIFPGFWCGSRQCSRNKKWSSGPKQRREIEELSMNPCIVWLFSSCLHLKLLHDAHWQARNMANEVARHNFSLSLEDFSSLLDADIANDGETAHNGDERPPLLRHGSMQMLCSRLVGPSLGGKEHAETVHTVSTVGRQRGIFLHMCVFHPPKLPGQVGGMYPTANLLNAMSSTNMTCDASDSKHFSHARAWPSPALPPAPPPLASFQQGAEEAWCVHALHMCTHICACIHRKR
eukprot:362783-Chlamydomonas_euryale.AAC.5